MPYRPQIYDWARDIIEAKQHTLFAGCTGSGKSKAEESLLYTMLEKSPYDNLMVLLDTKKVQLVKFKNAPHCVKYTSDKDEIPFILKKVIDIMDARLDRMVEKEIEQTDEPTLWIVIDEFNDILTLCDKKACIPLLNLIATRGRAAGIVLLVCTQRCTRDVVNGTMASNLSLRLGLHTVTAQDSRNVIQIKGCEELPQYGKGILLMNGKHREIDIPLTKNEYIKDRVESWNQIDWKAMYGSRQ